MANRPALPAVLRYALQGLAYGAFATVVGYFSSAPGYRQLGDDQALLKLSFSHSGQLKFACRERSAEELARVEPNMRNKLDCPRERAPVRVELDMDGAALFRITTPPLGLRKDGAATVYRKLVIPAGIHQFSARLADGPNDAINFTSEQRVDLAPGQVLIVDFLTGKGGFVFTGG
jgi:hypothetical protein